VDTRNSSASCAPATRLAVHECGCVVTCATDSRGTEYPVEVNGCLANDEMFEDYLASDRSERNIDFVTRVKAHRGREVV
jgi:hypothetical protein